MTIVIAAYTNLIAGALITEVISPDGRYVARRGLSLPGWVITPARGPGVVLRQYPDAPGMNALVALRRFLAERERDTIGNCDMCGEMMYRDEDAVMQPVTIAGETNAATFQAHRRCVEGED